MSIFRFDDMFHTYLLIRERGDVKVYYSWQALASGVKIAADEYGGKGAILALSDDEGEHTIWMLNPLNDTWYVADWIEGAKSV